MPATCNKNASLLIDTVSELADAIVHVDIIQRIKLSVGHFVLPFIVLIFY